MKKYIIVFILVCGIPFTSLAWGVLGHRVVGEIASYHLTPKAKRSIKKILGDESIAMASNWADFIKSDKSYVYLNTWHYINMASATDSNAFYQRLYTDTTTNIYNRINFLIEELRSGDADIEKKRMYLKLLIHLVGDAHQPLHTGRPEDRGGNDIKVFWFNTPSNLHRLWDEQLIDFQQLSYTEHAKAINTISAGRKKELQRQPLAEWLYESYQIAQNIYMHIKPDARLSYDYNYRYVAVMNQQLLKGGVRLAGVLNSIFG